MQARDEYSSFCLSRLEYALNVQDVIRTAEPSEGEKVLVFHAICSLYGDCAKAGVKREAEALMMQYQRGY